MLGLTKKSGCLVVGATLLLATVGGRADKFPNKPVHIMVPYAAGGAVDVLARTLGQSLAKTWGQKPVIENRPGAGWHRRFTGADASGAGRHHVDPGRERAPAQSVHLSKIALRYLQGFYGHQRDCNRRRSPFWFQGRVRTRTFKTLLAAARKDPDSLSYGMAGNGTSSHLAGEFSEIHCGREDCCRSLQGRPI